MEESSIVKIYVGIYLDTLSTAVIVCVNELNQAVVLKEFMNETSFESLVEEELLPYLTEKCANYEIEFNLKSDRKDAEWRDILSDYGIDFNDLSKVDENEMIENVKKMLSKIVKGQPQLRLRKNMVKNLQEGFLGAYCYKNRNDPSLIDFNENPIKNKYARFHVALQNSLYFYKDFLYNKNELPDSVSVKKVLEKDKNRMTGY